MKRSQRGIALITAILIVAIVAAVATSLALAQQVWLRQTQNLIDLARAERLRQGAAEFAAAIVARDAQNNQTDHLQEEWAKEIPPLPTDGGAVAIRIVDAQSLFNLNNLGRPEAPPPTGGTQPQKDDYVFLNLLQNLKVEAAQAESLLRSLQDWLDEDQNPRPNGAEDIDYYLNHDPPYRAANRLLTTVDELRLVKGFTEEIIEGLRPHVIALPSHSVSLNVNTAPAMVIAAAASIDPAMGAAIERNETTGPFQTVEEFKSAVQKPNLAGNFDVKTTYFIVSVEARIGRVRRVSEALIERPANGQNVKVLWFRQPAPKITIDEDES